MKHEFAIFANRRATAKRWATQQSRPCVADNRLFGNAKRTQQVIENTGLVCEAERCTPEPPTPPISVLQNKPNPPVPERSERSEQSERSVDNHPLTLIASSHSPMVRICLVFALLACARVGSAQEKDKPNSGALTVEEAKKLKNPIPNTRKSISQGRNTFARYCTGCHGADGKATVDVMGDASDLTSPKTWKNGSTEGEIFRSIRDGESASMPAFKTQLRQESDIWDLVNFIHSLWPESMRPPIKE